MQSLARLILTALFLLCVGIVADAAAQSSAPGAGHGFLIDKHVAAKIDCATCHSAAPPPAVPAMSVCTGCHGPYQQVAAKTASDEPNPHASHQGDIPCTVCHHIHKKSENFCDQCHSFGQTTP